MKRYAYNWEIGRKSGKYVRNIVSDWTYSSSTIDTNSTTSDLRSCGATSRHMTHSDRAFLNNLRYLPFILWTKCLTVIHAINDVKRRLNKYTLHEPKIILNLNSILSHVSIFFENCNGFQNMPNNIWILLFTQLIVRRPIQHIFVYSFLSRSAVYVRY